MQLSLKVQTPTPVISNLPLLSVSDLVLYVESHFVPAVRSALFPAVSAACLASILCRDSLLVPGEEAVLEAVLAWAEGAGARTREEVAGLLAHIRTHFLTDTGVLNRLETYLEKHQLELDIPECQSLSERLGYQDVILLFGNYLSQCFHLKVCKQMSYYSKFV